MRLLAALGSVMLSVVFSCGCAGDGQGRVPTTGPIVPCTGKGSLGAWSQKYVCLPCVGDIGYGLECVDGYLACPKFQTTATGEKYPVPDSIHLISWEDYKYHTGACASSAWLWLPGFRLESPAGLETARDPMAPLTLASESGPLSYQRLDSLFWDPVAGAAAIHALVTLTDLQTGQPVDYAIGVPQTDTETHAQTLDLAPPPLATNAWYRITLQPGDAQTFLKVLVFGPTHAFITAPLTRDFYTGSRPMLASASVVWESNDQFAGHVQFDFSEPLAAAELAGAVSVTVDGAPLTGCHIAFEFCPGPFDVLPEVTSLRLEVATVPVDFKTLELHVPAAAHAVQGGTLGQGAKDNPYANVVGNEVVYTVKRSEMTSNGLVTRWWYVGK